MHTYMTFMSHRSWRVQKQMLHFSVDGHKLQPRLTSYTVSLRSMFLQQAQYSDTSCAAVTGVLKAQVVRV